MLNRELQRTLSALLLSITAGILSGFIFFALATPAQRTFLGDSNITIWITHLVIAVASGMLCWSTISYR